MFFKNWNMMDSTYCISIYCSGYKAGANRGDEVLGMGPMVKPTTQMLHLRPAVYTGTRIWLEVVGLQWKPEGQHTNLYDQRPYHESGQSCLDSSSTFYLKPVSNNKVTVIQQSKIRLLITRLGTTYYYFVTMVTPVSLCPAATKRHVLDISLEIWPAEQPAGFYKLHPKFNTNTTRM